MRSHMGVPGGGGSWVWQSKESLLLGYGTDIMSIGGLSPPTHTQTHEMHTTRRQKACQDTRPMLRGTCFSHHKGRCPQPGRPRACELGLNLGHVMGVPQEEPRQPSSPSWGLQILTLPRHHPLGVPLGQHPRVPVEAGLLHLREERNNCDNTSPVHWERNPKL